jgi:hypothetical protein
MSAARSARHGRKRPGTVTICQLTKDVQLEVATVKGTRTLVRHKKLHFIRLAQYDVEITNIIRSRRKK